jgi:hypothetical protein
VEAELQCSLLAVCINIAANHARWATIPLTQELIREAQYDPNLWPLAFRALMDAGNAAGVLGRTDINLSALRRALRQSGSDWELSVVRSEIPPVLDQLEWGQQIAVDLGGCYRKKFVLDALHPQRRARIDDLRQALKYSEDAHNLLETEILGTWEAGGDANESWLIMPLAEEARTWVTVVGAHARGLLPTARWAGTQSRWHGRGSNWPARLSLVPRRMSATSSSTSSS